jgi:hypothetical protein
MRALAAIALLRSGGSQRSFDAQCEAILARCREAGAEGDRRRLETMLAAR